MIQQDTQKVVHINTYSSFLFTYSMDLIVFFVIQILIRKMRLILYFLLDDDHTK